MERLTEKTTDNSSLNAYKIQSKNLNYHCVAKDKRGDITYYGQHVNKLAEYENLEELIGIPLKNLAEICNSKIPEECRNPKKAIVLTDKDADRWSEYKSAEEEGLLLRLPCKVGDTVYAICTCEAVDTVLDGTLYGPNGGFGTATGYYCPYELSDKCPHIDADDCDECKNTEAVFEDTIDYIGITEFKPIIGLKQTNLCVNVDEIGETVFRTKTEAEQKLKEMESD